MHVIGVTGSIAGGKSVVSEQLAHCGALILDADRIGHLVLELPEVRAALRERWGDRVFRGAGEPGQTVVNRAAVAEIVFAPGPAGPRELDFLESLTHPRISQRIQQQLQRWRGEEHVTAVVIDAPVLYKAGWDAYCDWIVFVDAPFPVRVARAALRGWSPAQLQARQERQPSLAYQRARADVVIDNGGTREATAEQVQAFWDRLFPSGKKTR
jgi:dephospho-CoA kinase